MTTSKKIHGVNYVNLVSSSSESSDEEDKRVPNQEYHHHDLDVDTTVCVLNQFILDDSILAEYGEKGGEDSSDDEIQVLEEFDVENKKCGGYDGNDNNRKCDNNSMELLSWVKNVAVNPCGESKIGLTCNNKNPKKKKVLSYREAASNKKRFRSSREQQFWKGQKMCPSLYEEEPKDGIYNLRKKVKKNNNEKFSSKRSTFSIRSRTTSNASLDPQKQEEKKEDKEKKHTAKKMPNNSKQKSFFDRHVRVKHVPIGPRHQVMVPEWNGGGGGGTASLESDSKWLGTRIWPLKDGMNPRVMIERDPIGKGRQDSCGCSARGLVDCVGFHVAEKRTKLKLELGRAFYELDLDKPRVDTKKLLSEEEEEE
ncbi:AT-rich interactive domain-containing protein 1-like [Arachis stenosperma]|uniref:AT-rich interactive domain-containing protein 1-like n=1 Tax=Arachis stenosperma TaxID=217475 RepID=UPI0025ACE47E|nr:AT-rich interactive domain-containing protein 1-like [Arachis stenosperma]